MLSQVVTNQVVQQRGVCQDMAYTSRIHELWRMNPLYFNGSSVTKKSKKLYGESTKSV